MLRSGQTASTYFDKYLFEAQPKILKPLAHWMSSLVGPNVDVIAGLELGGIPLATALSLETGLPTVFVRKQAKSYGTEKAIEGPDVRGKRVVVVEDVVSTGGAIIDSVQKLRFAGGQVDRVVCAIWRGTDQSQLQNAGLELFWTLSASDLEQALH